MAEFIFGDECSDLAKYRFLAWWDRRKKEISSEVLTDHVAGEFAYGIINHVLNVAAANFDKFLGP